MKRLQDIRGDADGDALGGFPDRVAREVRIAGGRLHPAVTEQPADDRQPLAERERPRGEGVADVVDAHVVESGLGADALPRPVDVGHVPARLRAGNDPGIVRLARQAASTSTADAERWTVRSPGFPVDDADLRPVEIDVLPAQCHDLGLSAARQHQQAERRDRPAPIPDCRCRRPRPAPARCRPQPGGSGLELNANATAR